MALPCLQPKNSDFRGYPNLTPVDYWKTTASNPCTVNTSTFIYEPLIYNDIDGKYYAGSNLANGKYFDNPDGNGSYKVIVNGVVDTSTIAAANYTCNRLPNNEATRDYFENILSGKRSAYDVYNNYLLVAYVNLNIVVRYPTNSGSSPVGKIVAGGLGNVDLGDSVNNYLGNPTAIKVNPSNGRFVVYSSGIHKSFKVFDINGTFLYKCNDATGSTMGDLNYKPATSSLPALEPVNWDGLIGKLTHRDFGSSSSQQDQTVNNLWHVEHLDFITTPSSSIETIIVGIWNFNNNTKENKYSIYAITLFPGGNFGITAISQDLYHITGYQGSDSEMIPAVCVSKVVSLGSTGSRVELSVIFPRWTGSNKNYYHRQINATTSQTAVLGSLPGFLISSLSVVNLGSFSTGIGDQIFEGNLKAEIRRNSSGQLFLNVNDYLYSKWAYNREIVKQWWITLNVTGALIGAGFALAALPEIVYLGTIWGASISVGGIVGVLIGAAITLVTYLVFKPKDRASYAMVIITPSTGTGTTTYTRTSGHWISHNGNNNIYLSWLSMSSGSLLLQTFCVQSGTTLESNTVYALQNSNPASHINKGLATSRFDNTSIVLW